MLWNDLALSICDVTIATGPPAAHLTSSVLGVCSGVTQGRRSLWSLFIPKIQWQRSTIFFWKLETRLTCSLILKSWDSVVSRKAQFWLQYSSPCDLFIGWLFWKQKGLGVFFSLPSHYHNPFPHQWNCYQRIPTQVFTWVLPKDLPFKNAYGGRHHQLSLNLADNLKGGKENSKNTCQKIKSQAAHDWKVRRNFTSLPSTQQHPDRNLNTAFT